MSESVRMLEITETYVKVLGSKISAAKRRRKKAMQSSQRRKTIQRLGTDAFKRKSLREKQQPKLFDNNVGECTKEIEAGIGEGGVGVLIRLLKGEIQMPPRTQLEAKKIVQRVKFRYEKGGFVPSLQPYNE